jgi:hypothetical protein
MMSMRRDTIAALLIALSCSLIACHKHMTYYGNLPVTGVRAAARATVVGDSLVVTATAESVSDHPLTKTWGACYNFSDLVVVAEAHSRKWDSFQSERDHIPVRRDSTGKPVLEMCIAVAFQMMIKPGGLMRYQLRVPVAQILGDSLPPGKYQITARFYINGGQIKNLHAGVVELRRSH